MEIQLRTISKNYDWFQAIRVIWAQNRRNIAHPGTYIRLIRSHTVIDLAQNMQRQNMFHCFCRISFDNFPCVFPFASHAEFVTNEKCQWTRGDRINIGNGVEHEQTNHVSSAHICSEQHAYVAEVATTRATTVVNVFVFLFPIFVLPRIVKLPNVGSKQASGLNENISSSESCSYAYVFQARS